MTQIKIINGTYNIQGAPTDMSGRVFPLVKPWKEGKRASYITVDATPHEDLPDRNIKIVCDGDEDWEYASEEDAEMANINTEKTQAKEPVDTRSDEEIKQEHRRRFEMLSEMTGAARKGDIRSMIVSGPPGVGKSFGVEAKLEQNNLMATLQADGQNDKQNKFQKYKFCKGALSAIGLYQELYYYSNSDNVVVFDDCDGVFTDELSLNLLKAALDSKKTREICWNTDSRQLREAGIPNSFPFEGSAIFITNLSFDQIRSKKLQEHLAALESRSHYFDLGLRSTREKMLRIRQLIDDGMLDENGIKDKDLQEEIYNFVYENKDHLREISLRSVIKTADLAKAFPKDEKWKEFARTTIMK